MTYTKPGPITFPDPQHETTTLRLTATLLRGEAWRLATEADLLAAGFVRAPEASAQPSETGSVNCEEYGAACDNAEHWQKRAVAAETALQASDAELDRTREVLASERQRIADYKAAEWRNQTLGDEKEEPGDCPECDGSGNIVSGSGCTACGNTGKRKPIATSPFREVAEASARCGDEIDDPFDGSIATCKRPTGHSGDHSNGASAWVQDPAAPIKAEPPAVMLDDLLSALGAARGKLGGPAAELAGELYDRLSSGKGG